MNQSEKIAPTMRQRRRKLVSKHMLILWLVILVLECTLVISLAAWVLTPSQGLAFSSAAVPVTPPTAPTHFPLPQLKDPLEPTPLATQVVHFFPTATATPPLLPLSAPTSISLPIEPAQPTPNAPIPGETEAPAQVGIQHVVIITIDGLRPDALLVAEAPHLDNLIAKGSLSLTAQTVKISETLPSHASMLSGMIPEKHGILWGVPYIGWPGMNGPTLFSVAHDAGLSTAMVFGKQKLNYLALPNSVDQLLGADVHDTEVKNWAVEVIRTGLPHVLFIHFPDTDRVGHAYGWMSPNQLQSIAFVDGLIGELMAELEQGNYLNSTLLIVSSDHGGHGFRHGDDSPEDKTIPWLAVGPGVPAGITLTRNINTYDTAATALHALNLPIPEGWDGQPVLEIFTE